MPFHVHEIDGYWNDIGTLREYLQGNLDAVSGAVGCRARRRSPRTSSAGRRAESGGGSCSARVPRGAGATIMGPAVIGPRSRGRRRARRSRRPCCFPGGSVPAGAILARGIAGDASSPRLRRLVSALAQRSRTVHVPASSANLGPGYDVLGAALGIELVRAGRGGGAFSVDAGGLPVPADRANLVVRAFERLHPADDIAFEIGGEIPLARGLGSSAAAIVAGLLAADHLFELGNSRERIFELACEIEGHPDNVAAALFGGIAVCGAATDAARHSAPDPIELAAGTAPASSLSMPTLLAPPEGLEAILVIPDEEVSTEAARAAMPAEVPFADAVANVAAAAQLVLGIERSDLTLIERGLADRLHQPRRRPLYARSMERGRGGARPRRDRRDDLGRRPDRARLELLAVGRERGRGPRGALRGLGRGRARSLLPRGARVELT